MVQGTENQERVQLNESEQLSWILDVLGGEDETTASWEPTDYRWRDYAFDLMQRLKALEAAARSNP